jgi:uncharacterized protein YukE
MSGPIQVNTDGLRAAAGKYDHASDTASYLRSRVADRASATIDAIGRDVQGGQIADQFLPMTMDLVNYVQGLQTSLENTAAGVRSMATMYDSAEQQAEEIAQQLAPTGPHTIGTPAPTTHQPDTGNPDRGGRH